MPTASLNRTDSGKPEKDTSIQSGFTVIELLTVLAVVAIISALALPSYRSLIQKRQVQSGAEQIAAFISAVQVESVMRNERLEVNYQRAGQDDWCIGYRLAADGACDCMESDPDEADYCSVEVENEDADESSAFEAKRLVSADLPYPDVLESITGDGGLIFDPVRGITTETAGFSLISDSGLYALNVDIGPTGRVRICWEENSSDVPVPGYDQCL